MAFFEVNFTLASSSILSNSDLGRRRVNPFFGGLFFFSLMDWTWFIMVQLGSKQFKEYNPNCQGLKHRFQRLM